MRAALLAALATALLTGCPTFGPSYIACGKNPDCPGGLVCASGHCATAPADAGVHVGGGCTSNQNCSSADGTPFCDTAKNLCVACTITADCNSSIKVCYRDQCVYTLGNCGTNADCSSSVLATTPACDIATNTCVPCVLNTDCQSNLVCQLSATSCVAPTTTSCTSDTQCAHNPAEPYCDTGAKTCVQCVANGQCLPGEACKDDVCIAAPRVGNGCVLDSDCNGGQRCCPSDGKCSAVVGDGADCDCDHPCGFSEGCVTGTCGETPSQCRPGCFPGNVVDNMPAQECAPISDAPAYCQPLPPAEVNPMNKGGACTPGNACNVTNMGSCPMQPVNRSIAVSPQNPAVAQTCTPTAPMVNVCVPAGTISVGGVGCGQTCGPDVSGDCVQGAVCVTFTNDQGAPIGPSECRAQCASPSTSSTPDPACPANRPQCESFYAAGQVYYSTGVCIEPACTANSQCAAFTATPCCNSHNICAPYASGTSGACSPM